MATIVEELMDIENEIRLEVPKLQELCTRLGIPGLRVRVGAGAWTDVTFIADVDLSKLTGYADRFFGLEEGLTSIFHRKIRLLDEEMEKKQRVRIWPAEMTEQHVIELLRAS